MQKNGRCNWRGIYGIAPFLAILGLLYLVHCHFSQYCHTFSIIEAAFLLSRHAGLLAQAINRFINPSASINLSLPCCSFGVQKVLLSIFGSSRYRHIFSITYIFFITGTIKQPLMFSACAALIEISGIRVIHSRWQGHCSTQQFFCKCRRMRYCNWRLECVKIPQSGQCKLPRTSNSNGNRCFTKSAF